MSVLVLDIVLPKGAKIVSIDDKGSFFRVGYVSDGSAPVETRTLYIQRGKL